MEDTAQVIILYADGKIRPRRFKKDASLEDISRSIFNGAELKEVELDAEDRSSIRILYPRSPLHSANRNNTAEALLHSVNNDIVNGPAVIAKRFRRKSASDFSQARLANLFADEYHALLDQKGIARTQGPHAVPEGAAFGFDEKSHEAFFGHHSDALVTSVKILFEPDGRIQRVINQDGKPIPWQFYKENGVLPTLPVGSVGFYLDNDGDIAAAINHEAQPVLNIEEIRPEPEVEDDEEDSFEDAECSACGNRKARPYDYPHSGVSASDLKKRSMLDYVKTLAPESVFPEDPDEFQTRIDQISYNLTNALLLTEAEVLAIPKERLGAEGLRKLEQVRAYLRSIEETHNEMSVLLDEIVGELYLHASETIAAADATNSSEFENSGQYLGYGVGPYSYGGLYGTPYYPGVYPYYAGGYYGISPFLGLYGGLLGGLIGGGLGRRGGYRRGRRRGYRHARAGVLNPPAVTANYFPYATWLYNPSVVARVQKRLM